MTTETGDRDFLTACFQENLEHARHVENERITFFSLYLVGVGMILGVAVDPTIHPLFAIAATVLLLGMGLISTVLLRRWNQVFEGHRAAALGLCRQLGEEGVSDNEYFYFRNDLKNKRPSRAYVHTSRLFELFNLLICLVDLSVLALVVLRMVNSNGI